MSDTGALPGSARNNSPTQSDIANTNTGWSGGLSQINPEGFADEDLQNIRNAAKESADNLQHRYDNPNWFNVAAGFAKPQLGGFLASLGSASEAMGQNIEEQRANQAPVANAKMNYQLAQGMLNQKQTQQKLFDQFQQTRDPSILQKIIATGADTPVAKAASQWWDQEGKRIGVAGSAAETANKYPVLNDSMNDAAMAASNPSMKPEDRQAIINKANTTLNSSKPPQVDDATWSGMSNGEKLDAAARYGRDQQTAGMTDEQKFKWKSDNSTDILPNLATARNQALGIGLKPILNPDGTVKKTGQQQMQEILDAFKGTNIFDAALNNSTNADSSGVVGSLIKNLSPIAKQTVADNPDAFAMYQSLMKTLASNQLKIRSGSENPTNALQTLQSQGTPNTSNSQEALVNMLDLQAHGAHNDIDNYRYIVSKPQAARNIAADDGYLARQTNYSKEHQKVAAGLANTSLETPNFYDPTYTGPLTMPENPTPAPKITAKNSTAGGNNQVVPVPRTAIQQEIARRAALKSQTP